MFALVLGHEHVNDQLRHDRPLASAADHHRHHRIAADIAARDGRFFHDCHDEYCHLALYIFCGERLLCAKLRTSNRDAFDGLVEELERIVPQLRATWPETRIVVCQR